MVEVVVVLHMAAEPQALVDLVVEVQAEIQLARLLVLRTQVVVAVVEQMEPQGLQVDLVLLLYDIPTLTQPQRQLLEPQRQ